VLLFKVGKKYKIEVKDRSFYTAIILNEDTTHVKILTQLDGEVVILKAEIVRSMRLEDDN